ncbi:hypothetical protein BGZ98_008186 [Dissophora globulifera]|nr:hypothetical protein BGZ98_008186 [Dissophora globulifera]
MPAAKSSIMMAILALFLCLSSTVVAADLYDPGQPLNCTQFTSNCKALSLATYGGGKNASYSGPSAQCNVTNLSSAQPLCGEKVICLATFLIKAGNSSVPVVPLPTSTVAAPGANGTATTTNAPASTPTSSGPSSPYTVGSVDLTAQLLAMYDTSKCASGALANVATSASAMVVIVSIVSVMSYLL